MKLIEIVLRKGENGRWTALTYSAGELVKFTKPMSGNQIMEAVREIVKGKR